MPDEQDPHFPYDPLLQKVYLSTKAFADEHGFTVREEEYANSAFRLRLERVEGGRHEEILLKPTYLAAGELEVVARVSARRLAAAAPRIIIRGAIWVLAFVAAVDPPDWAKPVLPSDTRVILGTVLILMLLIRGLPAVIGAFEPVTLFERQVGVLHIGEHEPDGEFARALEDARALLQSMRTGS